MFSELTVIIKGDEKKLLKKSFTFDDPYTVDENDPVVKSCIEQTLSEFQDEPDDIRVVITMEIQ